MYQAHPARSARPLDRADEPLDPPTNDDLLHGGSGWTESDDAVVREPARDPDRTDPADPPDPAAPREDPGPAARRDGHVEALGAGALGGAAIGGVVAGAPGALIGGLVGAAAGAAAGTSDAETADEAAVEDAATGQDGLDPRP